MRNETKNSGRRPDAAWAGPGRGDHGDDAALWDMLGEHGEVRPRQELVQDTLAYVEARRRSEANAVRRTWWGWGGAIAAAAASVALMMTLRSNPEAPSHPEPAKVETIASKTPMPRAAADVSEAALTAYEIDDLEEINQDWFGG